MARWTLYRLDPVEAVATGTKREMLDLMAGKRDGHAYTVSIKTPKGEEQPNG